MLSLTKILRGLEFISWAITIVALNYAAYFFLTEMKDFKVNFLPSKGKTVIDEKMIKDIPVVDLKPYDFYENQIKTRDVFSSFSTAPVVPQGQPQAVSGQLPANLKVVGVILGKSPQVAIEDTSSQQTYFIEEGAPQAGIQIDSIQDRKIYLNYNGQVIGVDLKGSQINLQQANSNL